MDFLGVVGRAGFHQQYADAGVFREPGGQNAAGRSSADDDVVVQVTHELPLDGGR
jgi:hypothetical protein